jgi:hypothetical protein
MASPRQPEWPQVQTTSVFPSVDSQWALQYFEPSVGVQLQAGFAHFLSFAIVDPSREEICDRPAELLQ